MEPLLKDPPRNGQPLLSTRTLSIYLQNVIPYGANTFSTFEKKDSIPMKEKMACIKTSLTNRHLSICDVASVPYGIQ